MVRGSVNIDFVSSDRGRLHRLSDKELEAVHQRVRAVDAKYHSFVLRYENVSAPPFLSPALSCLCFI